METSSKFAFPTSEQVRAETTVAESFERIRATVRIIDSNRDGTIRASDLESVLKDVLINWSEDDLKDLLAAAASFRLQSDDRVNYNDFLTWLFDESIGNDAGVPKSPFFGQGDLGVSVKHIGNEFMNLVIQAGFDTTAKVHTVEPTVIRPKGVNQICPVDGKRGSAYVHAIHGNDHVGASNFMLSYTWDYRVNDIVDTLTAYCVDRGKRPERTYVWICCLCVNQHRVQEARARGESVPFAQFEKTFGHRVVHIGHIVSMMTPWRDPTCLKRVWCNYELYMANHLGEQECEVTIVMPPSESKDFLEALAVCKGLDNVWKTFAHIDIQKAEASVPSDRDQIFKLIMAGPGFEKVNAAIVDWLRAWLVNSCEKCLRQHLGSIGPDSRESAAALCRTVGNLFRKLGLPERSLVIYGKGEKLLEEAGASKTVEAAKLLRSIGSAKGFCKDTEGTFQAYAQAKRILEEIEALCTPEGAMLLDYQGDALRRAGDLEAALDSFSQALSIYKKIGSLETMDVAYLQRNIGKAKQASNDLRGAAESYEEAAAIFRALGKLDTPDGALLLQSLGELHEHKGDTNTAKGFFRQASGIYDKTGTRESQAATKARLKLSGSMLD